MKTAIIPVKIKQEQELYNLLDTSKETLSEE